LEFRGKLIPRIRVKPIQRTLLGCGASKGGKQEKTYLLAKDFGSVANTTNDAEATGVCDGSSEGWSSSHIHSGEIRQENHRRWTTRAPNYECFTYPASNTGCLIPKSSVIGVVMVAIVNGQ